MRRLLVGVSIGVLLVACRNTAGPAGGALAGSIIAGNHQIMVAKADQRLPNAVVEELVRMPTTGQLRLRRIDPERVLDLLVPRAYAQTVVRGSPVPGAVVCVQEDSPLTPFVRCTNTDANGLATFFFTPSTRAGEQKAEIRGSLNNQPAVFDTVVATVLPDVADPTYRTSTLNLQCSPAVFPLDGVRDQYGNAIAYRIVVDRRLTVQDTVVGTLGARTVEYTAAQADTTNQPRTFRFLDLHGVGEVLVGRIRYEIGASGQGLNGCHQIAWQGFGKDLTP